MNKIKTKKELFVEKAQKIHGDKYDYSKVVYVKAIEKVEIICPIHGSFFQTPNNHLGKRGCPQCGKEKKIKSLDDVIKDFKKIHGDKYDYSKVVYTDAKEKVEIVCPIHGSFFQTPNNHVTKKVGCPICSSENIRKPQEKVIEDFKKVHGDKYDYSKMNYTNSRSKIEIICPIHGSFMQLAKSHREGKGCPRCAGHIYNKEDFINKFKKVHGDKYDYSKVDYKDTRTKIEIICPIHGSFFQTPMSHLNNNNNCPICAALNKSKSQDEVISDFIKVHGDRYDYSKVNYVNNRTNVEIICSIHGPFLQMPGNHLAGSNCPKCAHRESQAEIDILNFVQQYHEAERGNRTVITPKELDIYVPSKQFGIEYNGLLWHSEKYKEKNYHLNKLRLCEEKGIRLIHIFEDEWIYKQKIVKARLKHLLGCTKNKIYARKCVIKEIDNGYANLFLEKYHIQGDCRSSIRLGLFYKNRLVALMTFGKARFNKNVDYELLRYCTVANFNVIGGASKLLANFRRNYEGSIVSYADKRWSDGNLYKQLGFEELKDSAPNYFYFNEIKRLSRNKFQKHKLKDKLTIFDPELSEVENMKNNGYHRIFDCGNKVYILK